MADVKYLAKIFGGVRLKKLNTVIGRVHERNGKWKVFIFFDILHCALWHGAGYNDYLIFGLYAMNDRQRRTFVTRMRNKRLIAYCNDPAYSYIFDKKEVFNERFGEKFLRRAWLNVEKMSREEFRALTEKSPVLFAKPSSGESGKGIEKLNLADFADADAMFDYIRQPEKHFAVVEELIHQHEALSKLYPPAVNTLRINTVVDDGGAAHSLFATCKMGNLGKAVDNMENDGLSCPVDLATGKICGVAHTSKLVNFDTHPYTGVKLLDYQLPFIPEALALCREAALVVPEIRFVGWDCCIMPDGPAIIEGNDFPGYDFSQLPEHTPEKIGMWKTYKELLPGLR